MYIVCRLGHLQVHVVPIFKPFISPEVTYIHVSVCYVTPHRARLQQEYEKRKRKNKDLAFKDFIQQLGANESNHDEPMFHYETCNTSAVDIRSFKDYFVTTIETLLISQRKLHIKVSDW